MNILAPVNDPREAEKILRAGADELYCGVLPSAWLREYSNAASANRREWKTANLKDFSGVRAIVAGARRMNRKVNFALNALYTRRQYPLVLEQAEEAERAGVDALIIADLGLLASLRKKKCRPALHMSTGGTVFNAETARFYEDLGVSRIILPRHLRVEEIAGIVRACPSLEFEVFVLNSGCKNIDGFCTFHHGLSEIRHSCLWNIPKKMNADRHILNALRNLPRVLTGKIRGGFPGVDSACLLDYAVSMVSAPEGMDAARRRAIAKNVSAWFGLISGIDPCGACRVAEFIAMGVYGVKVVGRNYSTGKKINDVRFLRTVISFAERNSVSPEAFRKYVLDAYRMHYAANCGGFCYYPDGM